VVNLREQLGMSRIPFLLHTPIIMAYSAGRLVGLIVDEVLAVVNLPATQLVNPHDILPEVLGKTSLLYGLYHDYGNTILVLDIEHLFDLQDASALAEAAAIPPEMLAPTPDVAARPVEKSIKKPKPAPSEKSPPASKRKRATEKKPEHNQK
jgi:CheW-like domain